MNVEGKFQDYVYQICWGLVGVEGPMETIKVGVRGPEETGVESTRLELAEQEGVWVIPRMEASTTEALLCGGTSIFSHISVAQLRIFTHFCGQDGFIESTQDETDEKHGDSLELRRVVQSRNIKEQEIGTVDEEEDGF